VIVQTNAIHIYKKLHEQFAAAPWVAVYVDRRRHDRRQAGEQPAVERRVIERRSAGGRVRARSHRLAFAPPGMAIYELVDAEASTDCPTCGTTIWFEMPRFGEPPLRLVISVEHEVAAGRIRHALSFDAFSVTGRRLISFQVTGKLARRVP
jgi:hypothetical protein